MVLLQKKGNRGYAPQRICTTKQQFWTEAIMKCVCQILETPVDRAGVFFSNKPVPSYVTIRASHAAARNKADWGHSHGSDPTQPKPHRLGSRHHLQSTKIHQEYLKCFVLTRTSVTSFSTRIWSTHKLCETTYALHGIRLKFGHRMQRCSEF
jgi:hypothetical protein